MLLGFLLLFQLNNKTGHQRMVTLLVEKNCYFLHLILHMSSKVGCWVLLLFLVKCLKTSTLVIR